MVTNGKNAYQGTISYTKNIDFDEEGYIKLSAPMCKIYSSEDDVDLDLPIDIFAYDSGSYKVITNDRAFNVQLGSLSVSEDTGKTDYSAKSRVVPWVGGLWHVGGDNVSSYTGADGTSVYATVISAALKYIELFVNRNTLVGNIAGNVLKQYDTSYSGTVDLTIPANFVITGNAYSNNLMGVITRQLKNNGNAYFFTWDGAGTSASAGYPVNDSYIIALRAYKSSWILITSSGELLYFNGGGFEKLGTLPIWNVEDDLIDLTPTTSIEIGNCMDVVGDIAYINCASTPEFSSENKAYRPFYSAGIYCYDPKVSLYHKHAPSYSEYKEETGTAASDVITMGAAHFLATGDEVFLDTDDQGLTGNKMYYAIVTNTTAFKLASSYDNAIANTALTITDGSINLWYVKRKDFGIEALRLLDVGLCKKDRSFNGSENSGVLPFFMGAAVRPNNVGATRVNILNATVPFMSNRGYVVYSKFQTDSLEDTWQAVAVKYSKLNAGSSIVVKAKTKDQDAIVIGDSTLFADEAYSGPLITWDANGQYFETTADLSTVEVGDEVHIFDGAGAGQSAHISAIALVGSTYQVDLDEVIRGITSNLKSCVSIDKWRKIGTITSADTDGVKRFAVDGNSPTMEVKLELRGVGVKYGEIQAINKFYRPSV